MDIKSLDYLVLFVKPLSWLTALIVLYLITLILSMTSGILNRHSCPNCGKKIKRSKRKRNDKIIEKVSFGILPVKRYRCYACYWEGIGLNHDEKLGSENNSDKP